MSQLPENLKLHSSYMKSFGQHLSKNHIATKIYQEYLNLKLDMEQQIKLKQLRVYGLFRVETVESFVHDLSQKGIQSEVAPLTERRFIQELLFEITSRVLVPESVGFGQ